LKQVLVDLIRRKGKVSAAELTVLTGKHKSTISPYIQDLLATGVIREAGTSESGSRGGKPRLLLELNPAHCWAIGVDAAAGRLEAVAYDFAGTVLSRSSADYTDSQNGDAVYEDISSFLGDFIPANNRLPGECLGIGIGFSGHIDSRHGRIFQSRSLGLRDFNLADAVSRRFGLSVRVQNDANAALLGEKWYRLDPAGFDSSDIMYFFMDNYFTSAGFGLILNGRLYEGAQSLAGELSAYSVARGICPALIESVRSCTADELGFPGETPGVKDSAPAKDARKILDIYAEELVYAAELLNPELLIIGGNLDADRIPFLEPFVAYVRSKITAAFEPYVRLEVRAALGLADPVCAGATVPLFKARIEALYPRSSRAFNPLSLLSLG